jgi:hypothetical protein
MNFVTRLGWVGALAAWGAAVALIPTALVVAAGGAESPADSPRAVAARSDSATVGKLQHRRVLKTLGIPALKDVALAPVFKTGFEREKDLARFYVTPQSALTRHEVRRGSAHRGRRAHVAWLTGALGSEPVDGPNHRGYPTIQLQKTPSGACSTPCLVQLWARINKWDLQRGEWLSLATFSADPSNRWSRVITVNVGWEGWLHLFHVPDHGIAQRKLQRTDVPFPSGRWVRITVWLNLDAKHGAAAVWQDGRLMSAARVRGGDDTLDQMHFGLYAPPSVTHGVVRTDDVAVFRVRKRTRRD